MHRFSYLSFIPFFISSIFQKIIDNFSTMASGLPLLRYVKRHDAPQSQTRSHYRGIEVWICYSTISFFLYDCWRESYAAEAFFSIAPGSPILRESSRLNGDISKRPDIRPYTLKSILLLVVACFSRTSRLTIRVPHLNHPTCHKTLLLLSRLRLIKLELYDDGFLGILEYPSVCNYLKPMFKSVCCWNIHNWRLSPQTTAKISRSGKIIIIPVDIQSVYEKWQVAPVLQDPARDYIIESKYMDYEYLSVLVQSGQLLRAKDHDTASIPLYFQHPWKLKQNPAWPEIIPRRIVLKAPIEMYLSRCLNCHSHVITGLTSTVVFLCELVRRALLPRFRLTLLLTSSNNSMEFHNSSELHSYVAFLIRNYSLLIQLDVIIDGILQS